MKASPELRARIEEAASRSGLSLSQEVERRLITSLDQDLREARDGGPHITRPIDMLGRIMALAEYHTGKRWDEDFTTFMAVRTAVAAMLEANRPEPPNADLMLIADHDLKEQMKRWRPAGSVENALGMPDTLIGASIFDGDSQKSANDELAGARERLLSAYEQAKEDAEVGMKLGDHIFGLFALKPRSA